MHRPVFEKEKKGTTKLTNDEDAHDMRACVVAHIYSYEDDGGF